MKLLTSAGSLPSGEFSMVVGAADDCMCSASAIRFFSCARTCGACCGAILIEDVDGECCRVVVLSCWMKVVLKIEFGKNTTTRAKKRQGSLQQQTSHHAKVLGPHILHSIRSDS